MAGLPGFVGANTKNVAIPHGVAFFFKRTGTSDWLNLGILQDVSITPTAEFLDVSSNHKGINAVVKRILTNRSIAVDATLIEVNPENIRLAFYGGAAASGSMNILESNIVTKQGAAGSNASYFVFPESYDYQYPPVVALTNLDGTGDYTTSIVDYIDGSGNVASDATAGFKDLDPGTELLFTYKVPIDFQSKNTVEILDITTIEGEGRFQIRNNKGGLAQIYEFDDMQVAPNGAVPVPQDNLQTLPLTITAQESSGKFGRIYFKQIPTS